MSTVSIIIPAYNAATFLPAALDDALGQTQPPHEVIVVDDGSTDDTPRVCKTYASRIRTIRQPNAGQAAARNAALDAATGDFVALMDADDLCTPNRLEIQSRALESHPEAVACFSGHWVFNDARETGRYPGKPEHASLSPEDFAARLLVHPITMMFRRAAAPGLRFPRGADLAEDMLFTALLRRHGSFVILPDVLYGYRRHASQETAKSSDPLVSLRKRIHWMRANAASQWPEVDLDAFESLAWQALAEALAGHYWSRRRQEFLHLREALRANWPARLPAPPELKLRWFPDVVWKLKGLVDAARGRRAS